MKLSDYIIERLTEAGSNHIFGMSGGAAVHMFDSARKSSEMETTFVTHEQSAALAADGFSRVSGRNGVAVVTSGPGATNLLTGTCCSYYDSIPTIMLTGQVATGRLRGDLPVRQIGFQETDVLSIFGSVTKYAQQLESSADVGALLDSAFHWASDRRPGPALVDVPDDLQRQDVEPAGIRRAVYDPPATAPQAPEVIDDVIGAMCSSARPVVVLGGGISTPACGEIARDFLRTFPCPILRTWAGLDIVPDNWPNQFGTFGVYGGRVGNHVVQNADFLLCIGTRLSQNLTGSLLSEFAPNAEIAVVDIDLGELEKFDRRGLKVDHLVHESAAVFFSYALEHLSPLGEQISCSNWSSALHAVRAVAMDHDADHQVSQAGRVNANDFIERLSDFLAEDEVITVDTGANLTWTCNSLRTKAGQRVISAWNFTPMGYAVAAGIGAAAASDRPVTCIIGDGGMQLGLGELATVVRYEVPLKIFLFNNRGHAIQKQTLETWLGAQYAGVDSESGLGISDLPRVTAAMGLPVVTIARSNEIDTKLKEVFRIGGPVVCNVEIDHDQRLMPFLKSGSALHRQTPDLTEESHTEVSSLLRPE